MGLEAKRNRIHQKAFVISGGFLFAILTFIGTTLLICCLHKKCALRKYRKRKIEPTESKKTVTSRSSKRKSKKSRKKSSKEDPSGQEVPVGAPVVTPLNTPQPIN